MSKLSYKALIGTALLAAVAGSAQAVVLDPGEIAPLPGTTVAAEPQLAGIIEVDELLPFSIADDSGTISGTVQVRVVRSTVDNTIDFYWRIFNDSKSSEGINLIHVGDFNTPVYDVNWRIDGLGDVAPIEGQRHIEPNNAFDFLFANLLQPGTTSKFFFIDTDAFSYERTAIFHLLDLDRMNSSMIFTTYAPSYTVPEAGSLALVVAGLSAIAFTRRRKH